ncbi:chitin deacetylase [Achlya hypogyna]|uniref:Chitin deacetylase n=1 Tax=Achlya hypogyna TaxID=1202772 RepID=A0A1V9YDQ4_ACHHY|nr:chitin deacetylase [Achlya hypogyna]
MWTIKIQSDSVAGTFATTSMARTTAAGPPRHLVGYGRAGVDPKWPGGAKLALQFVINYEEGGENCILEGDSGSEHLLSDIVGAASYPGARHMNMESLYEYGSRAGFWRLHRIFTARRLPVTVFAVGRALELHPEAAAAMVEANWEVCSHGYRWIDYQNVDEATERAHIAATVQAHMNVVGKRPVGIYQGKPNERTRRLVVEEGGFLYDADAYNDDLPYWTHYFGRPHLVVPYTLSNNDMKFVSPGGFANGDQFFAALKDAFDTLLAEGRGGAPKMMSVGLHCRIARASSRFARLTHRRRSGSQRGLRDCCASSITSSSSGTRSGSARGRPSLCIGMPTTLPCVRPIFDSHNVRLDAFGSTEALISLPSMCHYERLCIFEMTARGWCILLGVSWGVANLEH